MSKNILMSIAILVLCALVHVTNAQEKDKVKVAATPLLDESQEKEDPKETAKRQFEDKNYKGALRTYLELLKTDATNPEYNLRIGLCMLKTNVPKEDAYKYLKNYLSSDKADAVHYFELGRAYHHALMFDEAIATYQKFITLNPKKKSEIEITKHLIEQCENGKELIKKPVNVTFENLGKKINSEFADYYPFLPFNESFILFTTRRPNNTGGVIDPDGYYTSEMYMSEWKNNSWGKSKGLGVKLNTEYDEEVVGLSDDGKQLLVYIDHEDSYGDIYVSQAEKSGFGQAVDLGPTINTNEIESSATISDDGGTLIYASFRNGTKGESDLWVSKKLPDGKWGKPYNLEELNTIYSEDFPQLTPDGKTLYFASTGFNSIGGFDIFKSTWDSVEQKFTQPVNIGYPINSTDDNMTICYVQSGRSAYVSAVRPEGMGDLDIYRILFNDIPSKLSVITAEVAAPGDTSKTGVNATIIVNQFPTGEKHGEYKTLKNNKVSIALEAGKYEMLVSCKGHKPFKKEITVDNRKPYTEIIPMKISLEPEISMAAESKDSKKKTTDKKGSSPTKSTKPGSAKTGTKPAPAKK